MARRVLWQSLLTGGLLAAAVGCSGTDKGPRLFGLNEGGGAAIKPDPTFQSQQAKASTYGEAPPVPRSKPGIGIKPDTEVAFGDTQVEAAFADGRTPAERDQLLDGARNRYQKALKADPKNKGAMLGLARLYTKLEDHPATIGVYRQYLDQNPKDHATMHELAVTYGKAQDWASAVTTCEAALRLDPENRVYQKSLGMCMVRAGRYDDGYAVWAKVMPESKARFFLARALEHTGQMELVKQQTQLSLTADPAYQPALDFLAYLNGEQPTAPAADGIQQTSFKPGN